MPAIKNAQRMHNKKHRTGDLTRLVRIKDETRAARNNVCDLRDALYIYCRIPRRELDRIIHEIKTVGAKERSTVANELQDLFVKADRAFHTHDPSSDLDQEISGGRALTEAEENTYEELTYKMRHYSKELGRARLQMTENVRRIDPKWHTMLATKEKKSWFRR